VLDVYIVGTLIDYVIVLREGYLVVTIYDGYCLDYDPIEGEGIIDFFTEDDEVSSIAFSQMPEFVSRQNFSQKDLANLWSLDKCAKVSEILK